MYAASFAVHIYRVAALSVHFLLWVMKNKKTPENAKNA
ncbi:hypothetical protein PJE062_3791 [Pseudovibrio sp. JE062]|nr:hypothetical protein PJE062_3791 [Pseudovibrio sp. JE062]